MKVALSPTSEEGAQLNMQTELSGWDFEKTIADAKAAWNKELNKVKVYTADEASKKIFIQVCITPYLLRLNSVM